MKRVKNGQGKGLAYLVLIIFLSIAIGATLMVFPAAGSAPPPQWVWDEEGRVTDASGQYRRLTDEEACEMYDLCPQRKTVSVASVDSSSDSAGSEGGPSDGGGCK